MQQLVLARAFVVLTAFAAAGVASSAPHARHLAPVESNPAGSLVTIQTLARPRRRVVAFAQDGRNITWIEEASPLRARLYLRAGAAGRTRGFALQTESTFRDLTLAGGRAVWRTGWGGTDSSYARVQTVAFENRTVTNLTREFVVENICGEGERPTSVAGDGRVAVYSTATWGSRSNDVEEDACGAGLEPKGGNIYRVVGPRAELVRGEPVAAEKVGAFGDRIALVLASTQRENIIEVRLSSGDVVTRISAGGDIAALGLSSRFVGVAVGVFSWDSMRWRISRLEFYDAMTGRLWSRVPMPANAAPTISIAGATAVVATGNVIRSVDVASGRIRTLVVAGANPTGVSVVGRRVAWAESAGCARSGVCSRARIRALILPGVP